MYRRKGITCWLFTFCLYHTVLSETRLCSQCKSAHQPDCATNPPIPEPCPEGATFCSIIQEKNPKGEVTGFHRACATIMTKECVLRSGNTTACYSTCDTDGCNDALPASVASILLIILSTTTLLFFQQC